MCHSRTMEQLRILAQYSTVLQVAVAELADRLLLVVLHRPIESVIRHSNLGSLCWPPFCSHVDFTFCLFKGQALARKCE